MVNEISEPTPLHSLADADAGDSVASRVVFRNGGGTVSVFAFGEGQGLREHVNHADAIAYVLEGSARVDIAGSSFEVQAGEALHLPAGVPHALQPAGSFKMLLTILNRSPPTPADAT